MAHFIHAFPKKKIFPSQATLAILRLFFGFSFGVWLSSCTCAQRQQGSELVINAEIKSTIKGLDPTGAHDEYSNEVVSQIYETLLNYHYLKRPVQLQPLLAAEMPLISEDGLTYTFKLRQGVRFQDDPAFPEGKGRLVTAKDFIYSWMRVADAEVQSEGFWIFDGKIDGLNEWREKKKRGEATYDSDVVGLQAPDPQTLVIRLKRPDYQLNYILTMSYTAVVPREVVEKRGKEFLNHPVGTGPFRFVSWVRNNKIVLERNPNWAAGIYPAEGEEGDLERGLLEDAGKTLPFVDRIVFYEMVEDQPRWLNFMKGSLDASSIPKDNFDTAIVGGEVSAALKKHRVALHKTIEQDVTYLAFNMLDPVLGKNLSLRKAISYAYDVETSIQIFFNGRAIVAQSPIPPQLEGYDLAFKNPYREYSPEKAKKALADAGHPKGKGLKPLEYATINSSIGRQMAEQFKQNMEAVGIPVTIKTSSWPQFSKDLREKKHQMWGMSWHADYPDAENFLQLFYGPNQSPGSNSANFRNADFDRLYEAAAKLPPSKARTQLYYKMRDIVVENLPWVPNTHRLGFYLHHAWLKNYKRNNVVDDFYKYLRVDLATKKELQPHL